MFVHDEIVRAVDLQVRGYELLKWLEQAFVAGFIAPDAAHAYASLEESSRAWIERHYLNLPSSVRPAREDLVPFSKLFSTYLTNTFDLEENPGSRLYSPDAHCFCPCCSWMVRVPHLRPKKIGAADKKAAERMKRGVLLELALDSGAEDSEETLDEMLRGTQLREPIGLCTYTHDLLQRLEGVANGPATLALWRSFSWTAEGSPKHGFKLSAEAIMKAQEMVLSHLAQRKPV